MLAGTLVAADDTLDALLAAALTSALAALGRAEIPVQDGAQVCMIRGLNMMLLDLWFLILVTMRRLMELRCHLVVGYVLELVQMVVGTAWCIALHGADLIVAVQFNARLGLSGRYSLIVGCY